MDSCVVGKALYGVAIYQLFSSEQTVHYALASHCFYFLAFAIHKHKIHNTYYQNFEV